MTAANEVERHARAAAPWIERLARLGYAAKAVVYTLIGLLALGAVRGRSADSDGAMATLVRQPFGEILLHLIALGLLGYAAWRFAEAVVDPLGRGTEAKGLAMRAYAFLRGLFHGYLAWEAFQLARGDGGGAGDDEARHWTARMMDEPFGPWLIVGAGVAFLLYGLGQLWRAWASKIDRLLDIASLAPGARRWIVRVSRYGLAARGVVFSIIGGFLLLAGIRLDPSQARGVGGALASLSGQGVLLAIVAVGLISYGIYEAIKARYKRIEVA